AVISQLTNSYSTLLSAHMKSSEWERKKYRRHTGSSPDQIQDFLECRADGIFDEFNNDSRHFSPSARAEPDGEPPAVSDHDPDPTDPVGAAPDRDSIDGSPNPNRDPGAPGERNPNRDREEAAKRGATSPTPGAVSNLEPVSGPTPTLSPPIAGGQ